MARRPAVDLVANSDRAIAAFQRFGYDVRDLSDAWNRIGAAIAEDAAQLVPVRTGRLQRNIRQSTSKKWAAVRAGGARVPYADKIEYGGWATGSYGPHYIAPQPFLHPARERNMGYANQQILLELMRLADGAGLNRRKR